MNPICRRCGHTFELHTGECPCAPGKKICLSTENGFCLCREYKEKFNGEKLAGPDDNLLGDLG